MIASDNKDTIKQIYEALARGDNSVFGKSVHPDYSWRVAGKCSWSGKFEGQDAILKNLIRPLFSRFDSTYTATLTSVVADGDVVVAEVQGNVRTKDGKTYDNDYCFIFRFRDGRIVSVTEYGDTDLEERVLGPYQDALSSA